MAICLVVAWILSFLCILKGIKSSGKVKTDYDGEDYDVVDDRKVMIRIDDGYTYSV